MKRGLPFCRERPASVSWLVACADEAVAAESWFRDGAAGGKSVGDLPARSVRVSRARCGFRSIPRARLPGAHLPLAPISLPAQCNLIRLPMVCSATSRLPAAAIVLPGSSSRTASRLNPGV